MKGEDRLLVGLKNGTLKVVVPELSLHFDADMIYLEKLEADRPISAVYFDGEKARYFVKRFEWEGGDREINIITAHAKSELVYLSNATQPVIEMVFRKQGGQAKDPEKIVLSEFISVKGISAKGNQLTTDTLNKIIGLDPLPEPETDSIVKKETEKVEAPAASTPEIESQEPKSFEGDDEPPQITLEF